MKFEVGKWKYFVVKRNSRLKSKNAWAGTEIQGREQKIFGWEMNFTFRKWKYLEGNQNSMLRSEITWLGTEIQMFEIKNCLLGKWNSRIVSENISLENEIQG